MLPAGGVRRRLVGSTADPAAAATGSALVVRRTGADAEMGHPAGLKCACGVPIPQCGKHSRWRRESGAADTPGRRRVGRGGELPTLGAAQATASLSPLVLAYVVGPLALGVLIVFRYFGLVAQVPVWAYLAAIGGAALSSVLVEPWHSAAGRFGQAATPAWPSTSWRSPRSST